MLERKVAAAPVLGPHVQSTAPKRCPVELRGYVQIALDKGLFEAFPAEIKQIAPGQFQALPGPRFEPATALTRGALASKLEKFITLFVAASDREVGEEATLQ